MCVCAFVYLSFCYVCKNGFRPQLSHVAYVTNTQRYDITDLSWPQQQKQQQQQQQQLLLLLLLLLQTSLGLVEEEALVSE